MKPQSASSAKKCSAFLKKRKSASLDARDGLHLHQHHAARAHRSAAAKPRAYPPLLPWPTHWLRRTTPAGKRPAPDLVRLVRLLRTFLHMQQQPRGLSATILNGSGALPFVISTGAPKERSGEICGPAVLSWKCFPRNDHHAEGIHSFSAAET